MRSALPLLFLLLASLSVRPAHADAERGRIAQTLKRLMIRPMDTTAACTLEWRSTPYWLRPGQRVVETVINGWLGDDSGITPDAIRLGISGVYYESETHTFAIIGFAFRTEDAAVRAEKTLNERYSKTSAHRFMRRGTYIVVLSQPPPVNEECGRWVWEELGRRFGGAR